jgi:transposase
MPRTHPLYAPEYRRRIIELARAGRSIDQLAREFEPSANAIRRWSSRQRSMKVCAAMA